MRAERRRPILWTAATFLLGLAIGLSLPAQAPRSAARSLPPPPGTPSSASTDAPTSPTPRALPSMVASPTPPPPTPSPTPSRTPRTEAPATQPREIPPRPRSSVAGTATWYCLPGTSRCTNTHNGGLYAAAGSELRIGDWRGRRVRVCHGDQCVTVTLIDWCACGGERVIDLYSDAFRRLAPLSRGVIDVKVSW